MNPQTWQNNYLYNASHYSAVFTPEECQSIIQAQGKSNTSGLWGEFETVEQYRRSRSKILPPNPENNWIYQRLNPLIYHLNENYYHFKIELIAPAQCLEYTEGGFYDWHVDLGYGDMSARKLSIVVFLSDPKDYTGGQLKLSTGMHMQKDLPQDQGTAIFFPSYILHKVEPVTSGKRYTLVLWAYGPAFS